MDPKFTLPSIQSQFSLKGIYDSMVQEAPFHEEDIKVGRMLIKNHLAKPHLERIGPIPSPLENITLLCDSSHSFFIFQLSN